MANIPSLLFLKEAIKTLENHDIQGSEQQSGYMYRLAYKYYKNHDLDALDMEIFQLFDDMGLGAGQDVESRNHHMTYAYISGACLLMGWGRQHPEGRSPGSTCLYCCTQFQYKPSERLAKHLAEKHSATIIPTLIQMLLAFGEPNI